MRIIDNDKDLDILLSSDELKNPIKKINSSPLIEEIRLEGITKNSKEKIILEYDPHETPLHAKTVESYMEDGILVLKVYQELWRIEHKESTYNNEPVQDRYDGENKVIIYAKHNLPNHLKNYFGITK